MARRKRNPDAGWRPYGPGKFDSLVDSFLYVAVLDGWGDEEMGDSETTNHYDLLVGNILDAAAHGAKLHNDTLTAGERAELADADGAILEENSQGFVTVEYFDSARDVKKKWKQIEDEIAELEGLEDEEGV